MLCVTQDGDGMNSVYVCKLWLAEQVIETKQRSDMIGWSKVEGWKFVRTDTSLTA